MKVSWSVVALFMLVFGAPHAVAQQPNVGYYHKVSDDGVWAVFELVWSAYIPGVENAQPRPGDFIVPIGGIGGPWCDPVTGNCYQPQGSDAEPLSGSLGLPPVTVVGSIIVQSLWMMDSVLMNGGGGGGGSGEPGLTARPQLTPLDTQSSPCGSSDFADMPEEWAEFAQALRDFLNSSEGRNMWMDGNPHADLPYARSEQAGFLVPDANGPYSGYSYVAAMGTSTHCSVSPSYPGVVVPMGTIPIHTHPFVQGDLVDCPMRPPNTTYAGGPSQSDRSFLAWPEFTYGVVIDGDAVYVFARYESDDPIGPEERCGY